MEAPKPGPPVFYDWNGARWYLQTTGLYRSGNRHLHNAVWEAAHLLPVGRGRTVLFNDGNPANLHPTNLRRVPVGHRVPHSVEARQRIAIGVRRHRQTRPPREFVCEHCGTGFSSSGVTVPRFCSRQCRGWTKVCDGCGAEFRTQRQVGRFCSRRCAGRRRAAGGRWSDVTT